MTESITNSCLSNASVKELAEGNSCKEQDGTAKKTDSSIVGLAKYGSSKKGIPPFPELLMKVIEHEGYEDIICWLPDGKSFKIKHPRAFTSQVLPAHFTEAKYSSFKRKMHRWGFRHTRELNDGAPTRYGAEETFQHEFFQRDKKEILSKIECQKHVRVRRGVSRSSPSSSDTTPILKSESPPRLNPGGSPPTPTRRQQHPIPFQTTSLHHGPPAMNKGGQPLLPPPAIHHYPRNAPRSMRYPVPLPSLPPSRFGALRAAINMELRMLGSHMDERAMMSRAATAHEQSMMVARLSPHSEYYPHQPF